MRAYNYRKIDAFTSSRSMGNPAACIYLEDEQRLSDEDMLSIAVQHKGFVSEVVFCSKMAPAGYKLSYYSSECEVDFCGHGTIACIYSLIRSKPTLLEESELTIHTNKKGLLTVYNRIAEQNAVFITAPEPLFIGSTISPTLIAEKLGLETYSISPDYPIDLVDAGLATLIVPIATLNEEINVYPREQELKKFCQENSIDIVLIYSWEVKNREHKAHTRVFAPKFGYLEDPATGSGNSAFAHYMLKNGLWSGEDISIEQGGADIEFNVVKLTGLKDQVLFGGQATDRIVGRYYY